MIGRGECSDTKLAPKRGDAKGPALAKIRLARGTQSTKFVGRATVYNRVGVVKGHV
jgi:hypothetical protein